MEWHRLSVGLFLCLSVTILSPAKTAEPIEISFGMWTRAWVQESIIRLGAHWHHLANTVEPSMRSGDAAFCQITLTTWQNFNTEIRFS